MEIDKIIVLDCETTGVDFSVPIGILELAWAELEDDTGFILGSEFSTYVNPQMEIPPEASAINGIRQEHVKDAPTLEEIEFPEGKVLLVCHNVKYDLQLVKDHMNVVDTFCTLTAARRLLPDAPRHQLAVLREYCGLPEQIAHRAHADVRTCAALLEYLVDGFQDVFPELIDEKREPFWSLHSWLKEDFIYRRMPFGKYKGIPMENVSKAYLAYMLKQDLDKEIRDTFEFYMTPRRK